MNLQEYIEQREKELAEFKLYNEQKYEKYGAAWMPVEIDVQDWHEQEEAWLDIHRSTT